MLKTTFLSNIITNKDTKNKTTKLLIKIKLKTNNIESTSNKLCKELNLQ